MAPRKDPPVTRRPSQRVPSWCDIWLDFAVRVKEGGREGGLVNVRAGQPIPPSLPPSLSLLTYVPPRLDKAEAHARVQKADNEEDKGGEDDKVLLHFGDP